MKTKPETKVANVKTMYMTNGETDMETKTKPMHTETPWEITREMNEHSEGLAIESDTTVVATLCGGLPKYEVQANAEFIVRAVNSHEALLSALRALTAIVNGGNPGKIKTQGYLDKARAAIAQATQAEAKP